MIQNIKLNLCCGVCKRENIISTYKYDIYVKTYIYFNNYSINICDCIENQHILSLFINLFCNNLINKKQAKF